MLFSMIVILTIVQPKIRQLSSMQRFIQQPKKAHTSELKVCSLRMSDEEFLFIIWLNGNSSLSLTRSRFIQTGKLAALWPFLGICAEVFILCAIILVYEKRRNKEGLDESDTDQSPEQWVYIRNRYRHHFKRIIIIGEKKYFFYFSEKNLRPASNLNTCCNPIRLLLI